MKLKRIALIAIAASMALGQTPPAAAPAPAPKRAAAPKAASPVDSVIQLVKAGMSDDLIIKSLKKTNKPVDLSPADMVKLKQAGVSDNVIGVLLDPTSVPAPAAAAAAPPPPPPPAPEPPPAPAPAPVASAPAPVPTGAIRKPKRSA